MDLTNALSHSGPDSQSSRSVSSTSGSSTTQPSTSEHHNSAPPNCVQPDNTSSTQPGSGRHTAIDHHISDQSSEGFTQNHFSDTANWGKNLRLAMACMDGAQRLQHLRNKQQTSPALSSPASTEDIHKSNTQLPTYSIRELRTQLHKISGAVEAHRAELLELLVQFDEQQGWLDVGARNCCDWADSNLGICKPTAYEYLKIGRLLRGLPLTKALFCSGELSWSKVRLLATVATLDTERDLAHVSIDATVNDVKRIVNEFRWKADDEERQRRLTGMTPEDIIAKTQFDNRALSWHEQADGNILIRISLPPEKAQAVLKSLEQCENDLYVHSSTQDVTSNDNDTDNSNNSNNRPSVDQPNKSTRTQRRADALVLMAEQSLQSQGEDTSRADRYQVIMHVDKKEFIESEGSNNSPWPDANSFTPHAAQSNTTGIASMVAPLTTRTVNPSVKTPSKTLPGKRPWVEGAGPIAQSAAKRLSCDATLVTMLLDDGEPLNVGRKTRTWPTAMWRAITTRDRHCQFPGCSQHKHLQIHHIKHWADGGETSVDNGICLCQYHHTLVHEGGYVIERNTVATDKRSGKQQGLTVGLVSRSKKALLPTRHRFRFIKPTTQTNSMGVVSCKATPVVAT